MLKVIKPDRKRPKRRILLVNPPIQEPYRMSLGNTADDGEEGDAEGVASASYAGRQYTYPLPIGLLRIAGQLLREGNEIYFLDCFSALPRNYPCSSHRRTPSDDPAFGLTANWRVRYFHLGLRFAEIDKLLCDVSVDEALVGCTFTYHNESAHRVIKIVKQRLPRTPVRFGGIYPTLAPEVARGSLADEVFTGLYPGIEEDALNYDFLGAPPSFILIKGTSGCPHRCAYCAVHRLEGNRFTHRHPDDVFDEIRRAHERYGLWEVGMWDSNILMRYEQYLGPILRRVIDSPMNLRFSAPEGFDYRLMTQQTALELKAAGFRTVDLALESADTSYARNELNRSADIRLLEQAIGHLREAGFESHRIRLFVITGLPGQTLDNVLQSIRYVWSQGCNVVLFPFTPIPGTRLYDEHLDQVQGLPLKALHPTLYCCVQNDQLKDRLIELSALGRLNREDLPQREHFRKVISSPELLAAL